VSNVYESIMAGLQEAVEDAQSEKTVEAWEAGVNHPSGAASRILSMMELDNNLTKKYPFVQ
jgi:hypothetical protein